MAEEKIQKKKEKVAPKEKRKEEKKAGQKKEEKKSAPPREFKFSFERDPWKILLSPVLTEKNIRSVETDNKLTFIVRRGASKPQIRWAIESALVVRVDKINTLIDRRGRKKAIIKLAPEFKAVDIATRFGML